MAEVNVTPILRDTIKNYRKELKIRGDELSKKLRKNTSFISQLETGKIEGSIWRSVLTGGVCSWWMEAAFTTGTEARSATVPP